MKWNKMKRHQQNRIKKLYQTNTQISLVYTFYWPYYVNRSIPHNPPKQTNKMVLTFFLKISKCYCLYPLQDEFNAWKTKLCLNCAYLCPFFWKNCSHNMQNVKVFPIFPPRVLLHQRHHWIWFTRQTKEKNERHSVFLSWGIKLQKAFVIVLSSRLYSGGY